MYLLKLNANYVITDPKGFTFHYVSIKTLCKIFFQLTLFDLHSTMYLLKLFLNSSMELMLWDLHSTMYLLKLIVRKLSIMNYENLHSTM